MSSFGARVKDFINHPAGPRTIHFWAPTVSVNTGASRGLPK
ncbi:hypothetical protein DUNSADRAFT_2699 [Dunaliella salina]|uniref:Uncharacterized protein n=1 Tax=Dunaliella salina TaxID=3046 RepID=A0ABQ7H8B1_DUNSA|nr:hypothetical protein DUNSADRAFT_2699 [Dunaliella salina]|eukprot:KAF5843086.1 hypothetical protein DUNSADRAFT_2699 [Dunaliella salina]